MQIVQFHARVFAGKLFGFYSVVIGQIVVSAGEANEVILELNGVTISNSEDSPIKVLSADKVEISAKSGTENIINDTRSAKTVDNGAVGEGAINAKADLKLKGSGTLVVNAGYNNGVHTSKDLTIQKLSLKVTAYNNALKGSDSIAIKSGTVGQQIRQDARRRYRNGRQHRGLCRGRRHTGGA